MMRPFERGIGAVIISHEHKFATGQAVLFSPGIMDGDARKGSYIVLLCLPDDGIGFQYAIQSLEDAHERVVREHRLKAAAATSLVPFRRSL